MISDPGKKGMKALDKALFSSASVEWETPQDFFESLDAEFHFTLDPCCTDENAKCEKHYTRQQDGLSQSWKGETVFCNPPYGKEIGLWVEKCSNAAGGGCNGCYANPGKNRHSMVSQVHLQES